MLGKMLLKPCTSLFKTFFWLVWAGIDCLNRGKACASQPPVINVAKGNPRRVDGPSNQSRKFSIFILHIAPCFDIIIQNKHASRSV